MSTGKVYKAIVEVLESHPSPRTIFPLLFKRFSLHSFCLKMFKVLLLVSVAVIVSGQYGPLDYNAYNGVPNPYQFSYSSPSEGGQSSHQESGDGSGRVTGSYSVTDDDGRTRVVEYVADEGGFRANIQTNEPGTSSQGSADVTISSTADDGHGGGIQYGAPGGVAYGAGYGAGGLGYGAGVIPAPY